MTEINEKLVAGLLRDNGVERLLPVRRVGARPGCTVWEGRMDAPYGDASFQVLVYPLSATPESYLDLEEEITALSANSSERSLVRQLRNEDWAILITCETNDNMILNRFLEKDESGQLVFAYHPQLHRILGGDYFHELQGKWLKACVAPADRAMELKDLLEVAEAEYTKHKPSALTLTRPLPGLLAIVGVPDWTVEGAPPGIGELSLMQFVIGSKDVLQLTGFTDQQAVARFARQLFAFLAIQHRAGICFSRDGGCCLRPEFLLASGALTDIYFMNRPTETEALSTAKKTDLTNALLVTSEGSSAATEDLVEVLSDAVRQYVSPSAVLENLDYLLSSAAEAIVRGDGAGITAIQKAMMLNS